MTTTIIMMATRTPEPIRASSFVTSIPPIVKRVSSYQGWEMSTLSPSQLVLLVSVVLTTMTVLVSPLFEMSEGMSESLKKKFQVELYYE